MTGRAGGRRIRSSEDACVLVSSQFSVTSSKSRVPARREAEGSFELSTDDWKLTSTRLAALALFLVLLAACGPAPLHDTHASPDGVAVALLDALARRDEAALQRLAVGEAEFRAHIWPSLPAARPERNMPFGYVWGELRQKSAASLQRTLAMHGGRRYELQRVLQGPAAEYAAFRTHADTRLLVRETGGAPFEIRVCGSLVEQGGRWKVFSYVTDD